MAWPLYVLSVFLSATFFSIAPAISVVFALIALVLVFKRELRWLAGIVRASAPSPRTDP